MKRKAKFDRRGPLALAAGAFGLEHTVPAVVTDADCPPFDVYGSTAVVSIVGPLSYAPDPDVDCYQGIAARVAAALASPCTSVVLRIDSPGGSSVGCIETARSLRLMATSARKPLIAFVEGYGASAAYALACGASAIYALPSALVGSVGVIEARVDVVEQNKRAGVNVQMIVSGARKGDTHAAVPITDATIAAAQAQVDELAGHFFDLVAEARGATREAVAALEAGLFVATQPTPGVRLVDGTTTFEGLLAMVAGGGITTARATASSAEDDKMDELKKMLAALAKMAEGDGEEAQQAKKMLAALKSSEDENKDAPAAEETADDEEKPAAEETTEEEKKPAAKAGPSSAIEQRIARIEAAERERARAAMLATRPDLMADAGTRAWLSNPKTPLATVKNAVANFPKPPTSAGSVNPAAAAKVQGTRGGSGDAPQAPSGELAALMGLGDSGPTVYDEGNARVYRFTTQDEARARVAARKAGAK